MTDAAAGLPMTDAAAGLTAALAGFARLLRERGVRSTPGEVTRFRAAVGVLPPGDLRSLYWAGRACLSVPVDAAHRYDAAFAEFFLDGQVPLPGPDDETNASARSSFPSGQDDPAAPAAAMDVARELDPRPGRDRAEPMGSAASAVEVLKITPFAACTQAELAAVATLARQLRARPAERPARRMVPGGRREAVDLRATARLAMKTQADLLLPAWRQHARRPRQVVMLLDVSRSMATYSRLFLHFGYALAAGRRDVEVVCFGTQLTRVTGLLRSRRSPGALERAAMTVLDWNGGTRIADAVAGLRSMRSLRGRLRGAVVIICSDGLERGEPADLGVQISMLRRTCHQVIWVNPLAGDKRYRPLAGGMQAALPWIDRLMPGDTLAALQDVAAVLSGGQPTSRSSRPALPPARRAPARA